MLQNYHNADNIELRGTKTKTFVSTGLYAYNLEHDLERFNIAFIRSSQV